MTVYLDDDLDSGHLITLGEIHGHVFVSPRTVGTSGQHDAKHLLYAALNRFPILSRNAGDYQALHELVTGAGGHHRGVIGVFDEKDFRKNMRPDQIARALTKVEDAGVDLANQFIALNNYR